VNAGGEIGQSGKAAIREPGTRVPVVDLDARLAAFVARDVNRLRAKGAMDDILVVRVADRVRDLLQDVEPCTDIELRPVLGEEVIEPLRDRIEFENDGGPEFTRGGNLRAQNSGVAEPGQRVK